MSNTYGHRPGKDTGHAGIGPVGPDDLVLALDVGTTNAKAAFFDTRASMVAPPIRVVSPVRSDGTADARAVGEAIDELLDRALRDARPPRAVALTCAWHGLVGVNSSGEPTTPLSTWYDTRASEETGILANRVDDRASLHHRTGAPIHPSLPPPRLLRMRTTNSDGFHRTRRWCSLGEYLLIRWFGPDVPASFSMASGSGMYDQLARRWDAEMLDSLGLDEGDFGTVARLPRCGTDLPLRESFARRWPLLRQVPWTDAYGDGGAAVVGSGCEPPGRAALTVGTSAAARVSVPLEERAGQPLPSALFAYLLEPEQAIVGVARSNAGNLVGWARRVLQLPADAYDPVLSATAGRRPGLHGLTVDPSLAGERSPVWPPAAAGDIGGLRISTTALDVLQALLESAMVGLAHSMDLLERWTGPQRFVLSGGSATSEGWLGLLADATGRRLVASSATEASLRGAACLGYRLVDPEWQGPPPLEETDVEPDAGRAGEFLVLRERLRDRVMRRPG